MTTNRSERIEEAAAAVISGAVGGANEGDGYNVHVRRREWLALQAALASREEEPVERWDVIDRRTGGQAAGADVKGYWTEVAAAQACGFLCGRHGFHFETRPAPTPIADTFPRAPKDAEERETVANFSARKWCDKRQAHDESAGLLPYQCSRAPAHAGDHVGAGVDGRILARWPQPAPAKTEESQRWALWFLGDEDACPKCDDDDRLPGWCADDDEVSTFDSREKAEAFRTRWVRTRRPERFEVRPYPATSTPAPLPAAASEGKVVVGWRVKSRAGLYTTRPGTGANGGRADSDRSRACLFGTKDAAIAEVACWADGLGARLVRVTRRVRAK